ncbi:hypothetical protein E2C01_062558 [Portunus trituberculatus]|uniref:Uncharacterized protein n=1 Tax=Portunus trituberculatus TaxID=210409 RepID=A0A5B7HHM4_PORTR|nr:hypothetical protein [Portunus trituberculatus]
MSTEDQDNERLTTGEKDSKQRKIKPGRQLTPVHLRFPYSFLIPAFLSVFGTLKVTLEGRT